jgi:hypothetical protein
MPTSRLGKRGGDFLVHIESPQKCLGEGQLTAPTGKDVTNLNDVTAYPVLAGAVLAVAGDEANIIGFVIWGNSIASLAGDAATAEVPPYTWIDAFDGAVLNENAIPLVDFEGADFTLADIKAAAALANVKWVAEPVKTSTQTN